MCAEWPHLPLWTYSSPKCLCLALILDNVRLGIIQSFLWVGSLALTNANGLLLKSS